MNIHNIDLDLSKEACLECIPIGQDDSGGTTIAASIYDNGAAVDLTDCSVYMVVRLPGNCYYRGECTVSGNVATHTVDESKLASLSGFTDEAYFSITKDDSIFSTSRFALDILRSALDGTKAPSSWDSEGDAAIEEAKAAAAAANEAAASADAKADAAIEEAKAAAAAANEAAASADAKADAAQTVIDQVRSDLPVASASALGAVQVGDGLDVTTAGLLSVSQALRDSISHLWDSVSYRVPSVVTDLDALLTQGLYCVLSVYRCGGSATSAPVKFISSCVITFTVNSNYGVQVCLSGNGKVYLRGNSNGTISAWTALN